MDSNDRLLESLYEFITQEVKFHCVIDVVDGLRGGFWSQRADGAASYLPNGIPQICLGADYKTWPSERLQYVTLHELAHHRLGHVDKTARAETQPGLVYARSEALIDYTQRIEAQADALAKAYVKRFETWQQQRLQQQIQADIWEIKQLLIASGRIPRRVAR